MLYSIASSKDAWVANIWVVVALSLGLLDSYIIESLRKGMYFLGDCMNTPLGWTLRMLWCGWDQGMTPSLLSLFTPL